MELKPFSIGAAKHSRIVLSAFLLSAAVCALLYSYGGHSWGGTSGLTTSLCRSLSVPPQSGDKSQVQESSRPGLCKSAYPPFTHLRTHTPPLDFQWLALHESTGNVTLKGPGGLDVPLKKAGTLEFIENTIYTLPNDPSFKFPPGEYRLSEAGNSKPIAVFPLRPHGCSCPQSMQKFSKKHQCSAVMAEKARRTIAKWPKKSVTKEIYELPELHNAGGIVHLAVVQNKLYCKTNGMQRCPPTDGRVGQVTGLIQRVLRRVTVPDVIFMWNIDDGPMLPAYALQPVFSPSGSSFHRDFLLPTPYLIEHKFRGLDLEIALMARPWEEREARAYFLGSPTGGPAMGFIAGAHKMHPRIRAAELARERPDLLDVKITLGGAAPVNVSSAFPIVDQMVEAGLLQYGAVGNRRIEYKFALDLPGNSAAWRLGYSLGWGAMVIKNQTPWNEFWHFLLRDGENVRFTGDMLDDLTDIVEDARAHDAAARCIAREAQLTALLELRQEDLLCWVAHTLVELSSIMAFVPSLADGNLVEIPDKQLADPSVCNCKA